MNYEIPKEIKAKPKIIGLEMKELVILLISFLFIFTVLQELVHSVFIAPYFIISGGLILYLVMPSRNNPGLKNYMSLFLYLKRNKETYHAIDVNKILNNVFEEGGDVE